MSACMYVCLPVCLSLPVSDSICRRAPLRACLPPAPCVPACLFVCLPVCLYVCLCKFCYICILRCVPLSWFRPCHIASYHTTTKQYQNMPANTANYPSIPSNTQKYQTYTPNVPICKNYQKRHNNSNNNKNTI